MIEFHCKNCNKKIHVPEAYAGKKGRCPKCKAVLIVPQISQPEPPKTPATPEAAKKPEPLPSVPAVSQTQEEKMPGQPAPKGMPERILKARQELEKAFAAAAKKKAEPEPVITGPKRPWYIDIFYYPITKTGLTHLAIFIAVPLVIDVLIVLLGSYAFIVAIPGMIINALLYLYMYWYFSDYVRDSAFGGTRAPNLLATSPDVSVMVSQVVTLISGLVVFWGPAVFYLLLARKISIIFWLLLAYGFSFFPMALLSICLFDSIAAFNPFLLVRSIYRTISQYCLLVLAFCCLGGMVAAVIWLACKSPLWALLSHPIRAVCIYLAMVAVHLLGKFYWLHQKKLDWKLEIDVN